MKPYAKLKSRSGIALIAGLLIVFIISVIVVFTLSYVSETQRMTTQRIRNEQAFQVAEAGLHLGISWLNQWLEDSGPAKDRLSELVDPESYVWREQMTGNLEAPTNFITSEYILLDHTVGINDSYGIIGQVSALSGGSGSGFLSIMSTAYAATGGSNYQGRVWQLKILPPTTPFPGTPTATPTPSPEEMYNNYFKRYPLMRIQSVGRAEDGRTEVIVEADISMLKYGGIVIPAAIVAGAGVTENGQFNLHWGQAWAKSNMVLPKPGTQVVKWTQDTLTKDDPWVALKSVKFITDQNGSWWDGSKWKKDPYPVDGAGAPQVMFPSDGLPLYQWWDRTPLSAGRLAVDAADWILAQNIDALINSFSYDRFKEIALERGQYYYPDSSGKLYDASGTKVYASLDGITFYKGGPFDDTKVKADIVFIDTLDRLPPRVDGSNMYSFRLSGGGSGFYTKGILYINGNLDLGGLNNPSPVPIKMLNPAEYEAGLDPSEASTQQYLWHNGVLFLAGSYRGHGTSYIYGSIILKGQYLGSGSPDVYYKPELKTGQAFPFSSKAVILSWRKKTIWYNWN